MLFEVGTGRRLLKDLAHLQRRRENSCRWRFEGLRRLEGVAEAPGHVEGSETLMMPPTASS